ncbi:hypothetical protein ASPZODRAFT_147621 [Penicilliopsis zonata CBS 506.65]|uniref:Uncharacterized protein n=1 Tax=Penicilliopsis zonata CBS 506.65 TaxID=1073090 RepID=A0A1L9S512_9EURO|nr:hypothetical protein ASPZODRAFT_147621 [Penicilliopsis zonata CBS 506.65]OJJ42244.1 hypothetical protein ASPZODRAFT_147621 [Penicilliopsis zonata CBS 506.65]
MASISPEEISASSAGSAGSTPTIHLLSSAASIKTQVQGTSSRRSSQNGRNSRSSSRSSSHNSRHGSQSKSLTGATSSPIARPKKWRWKHLWLDRESDEPYTTTDDAATLTRLVFFRLIGITVITGACILGAKGESFNLTSTTIANILFVDQDTELAVFGLVNRLLEMLTQTALNHIASTLLTKWMTRRDQRGVNTVDFEMAEEFKNPWTAIMNFHERWKSSTRQGWLFPWLRFLVTLAVSISLLLLGASMNTIAIPKSRWWPDTRFITPHPPDDRFYFYNQTSRVSFASRMSEWQLAWEMIREGGDPSWEISHTMAASHCLSAFGNLYNSFNQEPGWQSLGDNEVAAFSAFNVPNGSTGRSLQSMAIQGDQASAMYQNQKKHGKHSWQRDSTGWFASLKLLGILLETDCIMVDGSDNNTGTNAWQATTINNTIIVKIGPYSNASLETFAGATCNISINQAHIPIQQWIYSGTTDYDYSINNWGSDMDPNLVRLGPFPENAAIATEAAGWFQDILPNLQSLSSNHAVINFTSMAVLLAQDLVSLNRGYTVQDGLAAVVATIFTDMLTSFSWTYTDDSNSNTTLQGPIRWQIYGSGPRLPWEWTISSVLAVIMLILVYDLGLIVYYRGLGAGPWLRLDGMMVAANLAPTMEALKQGQGIGIVSEEVKEARFFIRRTDHDQGVLVSHEELKANPDRYSYLDI